MARRKNGKDGREVLRWCRDVVAQTGARAAEMRSRSDADFPALTSSFRERLTAGEPMDSLLPEAFAAVREAAARTLGQRPFDVQVMGGAVLHLGHVVEMRTGEGKTLTATLPGYLNALSGHGVHMVTANSYLARRDAEWMGPVYRFLGLEIGLLGPDDRPAAYSADVTYGHWAEFGYDYLRDNLSWERTELTQRGQHLAIVDEADLILLDEALSPLLISGPAPKPERGPAECAVIAARLQPGLHYQVDQRARTASLTEDGTPQAEEWLGVTNLYGDADSPLLYYLQTALKAKECYRKDVDYIVSGDQAVVVDPSSGHPVPGRRYGEGLHEAIEAKEGLPIRAEQLTLSTVTVWDYLGRYQRLTGMTGTAMTEADAYRQVYGLEVVTIPTNRPMIRVDHPDVIYRATQAKLAAVADEAVRRHASGQPVLIGTPSVQQSEHVSRLLTERGLGHQTLTARNHDQEAQIIAGAARLGAVTVIAGMAGRGVDIILGGTDERADDASAEHGAVADRGGLCVLGTERSGSRRAELHLRGRAGRQGDPGESQFFVSLEDDLVKAAVSGTARAMVNKFMRDGGDQDKRLSHILDSAQAKTAASTAAWLSQMLEYEEVLADQQHLIFAERRKAVMGEDLSEQICQSIGEVITAQVVITDRRHLGRDDLWRRLRTIYPVSVTPGELAAERGCAVEKLPSALIIERLTDDAQRAYRVREHELHPEMMRELERRATLSIIDQEWREHLQQMRELRQTVQIRASGSEAPLAVYHREAAQLFKSLSATISRQVLATVLLIKVEPVLSETGASAKPDGEA
jgi:preprotein translocase subunit SecA